ncbi:hypothetical protein Rleg4DRAFT_4694 [Rhizobium leguminosarum bv. trifolii WSM2297]|uniref:Uncharacterized protein n=1 Tax=Rhizobium leguminosarum bv. trifolii WSM2297 TaxID=754762 RepID=J0WCL8_RHILT|nr:hypothetical protein [Rhizobium leguminosarum]EJC82958.1 hypothetical protein Rleg4DRAFT_4694 [Rhizobium leguminosarum bv. trifolii WSM2297]
MAKDHSKADARPDGHRDCNCPEAKVKGKTGDRPQTWLADHGTGVAPSKDDWDEESSSITSGASLSHADAPGDFKPGPLASES